MNYFAHHRDRLLELFAPSSGDLAYIESKYSSILAHPSSVCVHVRNYVREHVPMNYYIQYGREYFEKAMGCFPADSLFVIVSDDINYARAQISINGRNVVFIEKEPYYIDFFLQTMCKHNVISNSTFSWWGAWLNPNPNKIVVRPAQWQHDPNDINCPREWIRIEAKGI
jgi:hypothetical protein